MNEVRDADYLLKIKGLKTYFYTEEGVIKAVDGVDLSVLRGEVFGLVGESGCGKSVTAKSILRLIYPPGKIVSGEIHFDGLPILDLPQSAIREIRGNRISMIFQQPLSSLNPVFNIREQVAEIFQVHEKIPKADAWKRAVELLGTVGISDPERRAVAFPHEISGGQAQRIMIAIALALNPELLIADEPTTALDVTIQAQILDLIEELTSNRNTSVILITHDMGVIAEICDRVGVMYAGCILEQADTITLFDNPLHPYTRGLLASMPMLDQSKTRLETIKGTVPDLAKLPDGCKFAQRCDYRERYNLEICNRSEPDLCSVRDGHKVRCWLYQDHIEHRAPIKSLSAT
jgi:oligopeptide/dipeptide ABC transporter ATP-binding protein